MVEQNRHTHARGGAIINMSSVNAVMAIPSIAGYNASKGGVNNLTRCVAACTGNYCRDTVQGVYVHSAASFAPSLSFAHHDCMYRLS